MQIESSNTSNGNNNSQDLNIEKENIICKDGFCSIASHNQTKRIGKDDVNVFDPI